MKVAIVGNGAGAENAPFKDDDWQCWGENQLYQRFPFADWAWDAWFELHPLDWQNLMRPGHLAVLREHCNVPLYLQQEHEEFPTSQTFPRGKVESLTANGRFHCCTVDWMVAFAIQQGATEIGLFGVGAMPGIADPLAAKGCIEYWCGVAEGRGIVVIPEPWSALFHGLAVHAFDRPYGYEYVHEIDGFVPATNLKVVEQTVEGEGVFVG